MSKKLQSHPHLHGLRGNEYAKGWQADKRQKNRLNNRTWDGEVRTREIRFDLSDLSSNDRHVATNRDRRKQRRETIRLIDKTAQMIMLQFPFLPKPLKIQLTGLARQLGAIRRKMALKISRENT